jgi:hypothetical protein
MTPEEYEEIEKIKRKMLDLKTEIRAVKAENVRLEEIVRGPKPTLYQFAKQVGRDTLAAVCQVHVNSVHNYLSGATPLNVRKAALIARAYPSRIDWENTILDLDSRGHRKGVKSYRGDIATNLGKTPTPVSNEGGV